MGRFGLSLALILATFSLVSAPQVAQAAAGDTDTSANPDGTHYMYSASGTLTEYDSGTVEVWVKTSAACSGQSVLFGTPDVFMGCIGGLWEAGILSGSTWQDSIQSEGAWTSSVLILPKVQSNIWTHLAITWNKGGNFLFYYNGKISQTVSTNMGKNSALGYLYIGAFNNGQVWTGQADDFNYYKGVRTQSQIQADMNSLPTYSDPSLLAAFNFNDATTNVINRSTGTSSFGTNADLTINNTQIVENSITDSAAIPGYTIVKFTKPYLSSNGGWRPPANISTVDYLLVGGGGGAGFNSGGGGSGGGVDSMTSFAVSGVQQITVGMGGAPGTSTSINGSSGFSSSFGSTTVNGGNGGISYTSSSVRPAGGASILGSGYGGYGTQNTGYVAQSGGAGPSSSITGAATNYSGGGGGGGWTTEVGGGGGAGGGGAGGGASPGNGSTGGTFGTGNTGGGGGANSSSASPAGNGGSGVVIIRYKNYFGASVTISVNPKKTTKSAGATPITASTTSTSGTITFYANGRIINGCKNLAVSGSSATCNWRPMVQGSVTLTATFTPSGDASLSGSVSSAAITTAVSKRTTAR